MKTTPFAVTICLLLVLSVPVFAADTPKPESIAEKMSFKLVRGVTNFATSIAEVPKQIYITGRNHGVVGYAVVGPLKGVGMTLYRSFIGVTETIFFMVPQPGYYDPMIDPEFVWQGWANPRSEALLQSDSQALKDAPTEKN